ncbi:unnamed protein product [Didymodactylos carnosus]|uniref:EF-hand domain-containing protein n=1 Tax=Didymodactylos carnosus TaxID=1234261 RepID=A0A814IZD4_9BILA|nr:unnamed protein product [Didymodactylos carnosus]CAF1332754.1 unnamed protein product [Didymodactylos carnosus]CAF3802030.1 unnamed protein product [Didymodactylos carnosus]CAF4144071.1 unnamed protein product [Didymodactylos carnosus]
MSIESSCCSQTDSSENETMQRTNELNRCRQLRDLLARRPSIAILLKQKEMEQHNNPCTRFEPKYYQPDYCKECSKHESAHNKSEEPNLTEKGSISKTNKDTRKGQISTEAPTSNVVYKASQKKTRSSTSVSDLINSAAEQLLSLPVPASSQTLSTTQSINSNDNDTVTEDKIRILFYHVDANHDGYVDEDEFYNLMQKLCLSKQSQKYKFDKIIKKDETRLTFDEFYRFLLSRITDKPNLDSNLDKKPSDACHTEKFKQKLERQISDRLENDKDFSIRMQSVLETIDCNEISEYLAQRWINFNRFQRLGGELAEDILPGEYDLYKLACCTIEPKHAQIQNVRWLSCFQPNVSGICAFPPEFDGKIPVDIATNEHLSYYGCCLASSAQIKVSLSHRHCLQDFIYNENYVQDYVKNDGHGGLEMHGFAHLDCPLNDNSGYFILGRFVDKNNSELHLTAFHIPTKHTLYVPPMTIHSNDYLKGRWRTMLSDETSIDHVSLSHQHRLNGHDTYEHFTLEFVQ